MLTPNDRSGPAEMVAWGLVERYGLPGDTAADVIRRLLAERRQPVSPRPKVRKER